MKKSKKRKKYPEINGIYLHYKGGKYEVISMAKHSETDEDMVVYKSLHFGSVHVRPLLMWFNIVDDENGKRVPRFELIGHNERINFNLNL